MYIIPNLAYYAPPKSKKAIRKSKNIKKDEVKTMNHKKIMQKIFSELKMYKQEIDKLASDYQLERKKFDEEMEAAKGKYTESFIAESRANWKPRLDYAGLVNMARETHSKNVTRCISQLEQQLNDYFRAPADANFCATLTAIKALGVNLSNREFSLLQESANGYVGRRLLNELAVTRTKTERAAELKDGEMTRTEKETKIPYWGVDLPDIEKAYDALQSLKNGVNIAFSGYCGEGYALKDVVFPISEMAEETNRKLAEAYGVAPQKQTLGAVEISKMATSIKYFDENNRTFTEFAKMMDGVNATIPRKERKTELTEDDKSLIDSLIDSRYPNTAKEKAVEIARKDERLKELLELDERYKDVIEKSLREASDNE